MARQPSEKQVQRIHGAADALLARGVEAPTNDQVLEEMGGGSIADVSPAMREWRKNRKQAELVMFSLPDTVKNAGQHLLTQMWASIDQEARKKVEQAHADAASKTAELEDELQTCLNSIAKLEELFSTESREKIKLATQLDDAHRAIGTLEKSVHRQELDKEKALARLENAKVNESSLRTQVEQLQKDLILIAKQRGSDEPATRPRKSKS